MGKILPPHRNCIRTFSGHYFNVFEPDASMICIEDIAHALSNQCRFGGHSPKFYSVAQHCVLMSDMMHKRFKLDALLHDASEAYLVDVPKPIKVEMVQYLAIENDLMAVIARKFGFEYPLNIVVKSSDEFMLSWEWSEVIMQRGGLEYDLITPWSAEESKDKFLQAFYSLT
ncbi:MAG: hypothetical protein ACTHMC_01635 [Pseudobacter sp.]|uniref:hypothetical protein n=1 Tax=Pseudobacter sp. TaxID=2045420 RepID=UPI003F81AC7E